MRILHFIFFKLIGQLEITTSLRASLWLEGNDKYLMPSQFIEMLEEDNYFRVKTEVLDPENYINEKLLAQKFLFGHPGKIIGYGVLKEISEAAKR